MSNVTAGYGRFSELMRYFCEFSFITCLKRYSTVIASSNFYKLCVKAELMS